MKNSTLLVGLALMAGSMLNAAEPEVIRGIKITPDNAPNAEKYYYRISNMRIQRLNYSTGEVAGYDDATGQADWEDIYMTDGGAKQVPLPLFLPDGFPVDWEEGSSIEDFEEGDYKLTPQPYTFPYMGLALVDGNFWTAFSAQEEVMNPATTYWYFTKGSGASNVRIHNAVLDGTIVRNTTTVKSLDGTNRKATGFDTKENNYYVVGLEDLFEEEGFEMSLNEEQIKSSFALSTSASVTNSSNNCLDANNYIIYNYVTPRLDENGEPCLDEETGNPIELKYGFASVDRTWSPLRSNGSNDNHLYNNGSVFFVNEQPTADALKAIDDYRAVVEEAYKVGAVNGAKSAYNAVAAEMEGWINVPALWVNQDALRAIIAECTNWSGSADNVTNLAEQEAFIAAAEKAAQAKLAEAASLAAANGAIVTLQNMIAFRDKEAAVEALDEYGTGEENEYQLGNAYISAGIQGTYKNGTVEEAEYMGVGPKLIADANCEWEVIPVAGTTSFLLYNNATRTYIRKYYGMEELAGGIDVVGEGAYEFSWATTADVAEAAPFKFVACADPEAQAAPSEDQQVLIEDYAISTDITDNVRLESTFEVPVLDEEGNPTVDEEGNPAMQAVTKKIHRGSQASDYKFIEYTNTYNNWYADTNVFHMGVVKSGESGINEVEAAQTVKNQGIYDLQGRKVAKAGKGLYIINGKKTIVR